MILADEHVIFLDALATALANAGYRVAATATTRETLIKKVRAIRPQICVTDSRLADGSGLEVIDQLLANSPSTNIVVLTADDSHDALRAALDAGVAGYVHKSRGITVLVETLRRVAEGHVVVEGSFRRQPARRDPSPAGLRSTTDLTVRERECLELLVWGLDTTAMSHVLGVSRTTVRTHVQSVLTKLGVHSRLEAAALAMRAGLVQPDFDADGDVAKNGGLTARHVRRAAPARSQSSVSPCTAAVRPALVRMYEEQSANE